MAFRVFRILMGLLAATVAAYLIVDGAAVFTTGTQASTENVVANVVQIVMGVLILGAFYYALMSRSPIRTNMENIFSIPELITKLGFTVGLLCIYRVGFHVPLPGMDQDRVADIFSGTDETSGIGQALTFYGMFTGGSLRQSTLFGLGIMPYISASIIFQLLTSVVPSLERLQKEGQAGQKKIQEYTRYAAVLLCIVQASFWMGFMRNQGLIYPEYTSDWTIYAVGVLGLTAGTIFLMWLGEQIDEYGIGNGISLLIMAGIVSRLPGAIMDLRRSFVPALMGQSKGEIGIIELLFLAGMFVFVVSGAILITQGQRRIPIQQAKHTRGRRVYGGQRQYLPLRVNHGGVMPIIFASALMIFPGLIMGWVAGAWPSMVTRGLENAFQAGSYVYVVTEIALIFFFAYFWTTVQFRPKEMAEQLRDYGTFIPGLRPGKRTADYLERVMERITYCGAAFLAVIAVIPMVVASWLGIPFTISAFLGGTGLLIVVSVTLDLVQRIEANLVMRNYGGFLGGAGRIKGPRG